MKKLLEFIVKSIVSSPEKVSITEEAPEAGLHRLTPATPLTALSEQTSHPGRPTYPQAQTGSLTGTGIKNFIIRVPQPEIGLVIGQQGRVIKAIKSLLLVLSKGERFALEVQEA